MSISFREKRMWLKKRILTLLNARRWEGGGWKNDKRIIYITVNLLLPKSIK